MNTLFLTLVLIAPNSQNDTVYANAYNEALRENKILVIYINQPISAYPRLIREAKTIALFNQDIFPDIDSGIVVATPNGKGGFTRVDYKDDQDYLNHIKLIQSRPVIRQSGG